MVRSFVEGTQRGFISGLRRVNKDGTDGSIMIEVVHRDNGTTAGIDKAYKAASDSASSLLETWKRAPRLIRQRPGFRG